MGTRSHWVPEPGSLSVSPSQRMDPCYDKLHHIATSESCSDSLPGESYGIPGQVKLDIRYKYYTYLVFMHRGLTQQENYFCFCLAAYRNISSR